MPAPTDQLPAEEHPETRAQRHPDGERDRPDRAVEPPPRDRERQHQQDADVAEHGVLEDREAERDDGEPEHADERSDRHERTGREQRADAKHVPEDGAVADGHVDEGQHRDAEGRRVVEQAGTAGLERALHLEGRVEGALGGQAARGVHVGFEVERPGVVRDVPPDAVDHRALAEAGRGDEEPEQAEAQAGRGDQEGERDAAPRRRPARVGRARAGRGRRRRRDAGHGRTATSVAPARSGPGRGRAR